MTDKVPMNLSECSGCGACVYVCPTKSIKMMQNEEGFFYPVIDEKLCINCGICLQKCNFANSKIVNKKITNCYVVKHKNDSIRINSRSGAIFVAISDFVLQNSGVVYGCVLENNHAKHIRSTTRENRNKMCKSKYVQSDTREIYGSVLNDLSNGMLVLFTGTPCQIEGLLEVIKFKKIDSSNLFTMDIVCHGVPSSLIFEEYIKHIESKYNGEVKNFEFRDKNARGWDGHVESFEINGKKRISTIYTKIFYTELASRLSCSNCKFATVARNSDLTIADAWGIKKALPEFNDNKGVSLVIIQSPKGEFLFNSVKDECEFESLPIYKMMQPNLSKPTPVTGDRNQFWSVYFRDGMSGVIKEYGESSYFERMKSVLKYKIRKIVQANKYWLP